MRIICLDLEGVLIPEVWIEVATKTGIPELRLTTRDIDNYDTLMKHRIGILSKHRISLAAIQEVTASIEPLAGARDFLDQLRALYQVAILSDTYVEFAGPIIRKLGQPLLLCNELATNGSGQIVDYRLRQEDGKRRAVDGFRSMGLHVTAVGDSFNDISMIRASDSGVLFRPSDAVRNANPDLPVVEEHTALLAAIGRPAAFPKGGRKGTDTVA